MSGRIATKIKSRSIFSVLVHTFEKLTFLPADKKKFSKYSMKQVSREVGTRFNRYPTTCHHYSVSLLIPMDLFKEDTRSFDCCKFDFFHDSVALTAAASEPVASDCHQIRMIRNTRAVELIYNSLKRGS